MRNAEVIGVDRGFNPCFSGCCSSTSITYLGYIPQLVSILVLVDVALRRLLISSMQRLKLLSFNPCFSGCCSSTHCISSSSKSNIHVSILVLVDVALRQTTAEVGDRVQFGFNPCFSGCCSSTSATTSSQDLMVKFQSLF